METFRSLFGNLSPWLIYLIVVFFAVAILWVFRRILDKRYAGTSGNKFRRQVVTLLIGLVGVLIIIIAVPEATARGQLLTFLGIIISATITLSSTTLMGNILAGLMLRALRNFKPGDFVRVDKHFGRVSERGLFHVEIQTQDRDLTTLPNLYLATNPMRVVRASGTFVSAEISLGYDIPRTRVKRLLLAAAEAAELSDPYVHVIKLGDFSVTYRVAGLLTEVKQLITSRSRLREMMLDKLHAEGIEIVSPTYMHTRAIDLAMRVVPALDPDDEGPAVPVGTTQPEKIVFDKAEKAASLEDLRSEYNTIGEKLESAKKALEEVKDQDEHKTVESEIEKMEQRHKRLELLIKYRENKKDE